MRSIECVWPVAATLGEGAMWSPDDGTKPAFGGADGRTLYVTTARIGTSAADLVDRPDAGGLFAIQVDTPGMTVATFHMALPCPGD